MTDAVPTLTWVWPPESSGRTVPPDPGEAALRDAYRLTPPPGGTVTVASMIATLDGAATGPDGRSGSINGPADARVFHTLRALADAVVVGAGTVRVEGYLGLGLPDELRAARRAEGLTDSPALVVLTRSGGVPDAVLAADDAVLVVTRPGPAADGLARRWGADRVLLAGDAAGTGVDLAAAWRLLAARGLTRLVVEGGPHLLADLVEAGLVDGLCLTWSPLLVGDRAPHLLAGAPLTVPQAARLDHLLVADPVLLGRWSLPRR